MFRNLFTRPYPLILIITLLLAAVALVIGLLMLWLREPAPPAPTDADRKLSFTPLPVAEIPGWEADNLARFRPALDASCARNTEAVASGAASDSLSLAMNAACAELPPPGDNAGLKAHLATRWTAWRIGEGLPSGLTGYFAPVYRGARTPSDEYRTPLYRRPDDLVTVRLEEYMPNLAGRRIVGRVDGKFLVPYATRKEIREGALEGRELELLWLADPVDAFFLQIQGSGQISLPDGGIANIGYAAQNGRPYRAIGRALVEQGLLPSEGLSMQSIRGWLAANPDKADAVMDLNTSYIFFTEREQPGAVGAEGVVLTPGRSIAIDRRIWRFGLPFWIDGGQGLRRLTMGQDTGGAIRGAVRADFFTGYGPKAGALAGRMDLPLNLWMLLPGGVTPETTLRNNSANAPQG